MNGEVSVRQCESVEGSDLAEMLELRHQNGVVEEEGGLRGGDEQRTSRSVGMESSRIVAIRIRRIRIWEWIWI